jgi:endonuclease/exonuclease/phosphatase family metal-dependent hydrolase
MKLRVLSYNIHKGVGTDGVTDLPRIADVIRHYDADVVALQEVMWYEPWRRKRSHYQELFDLLEMPHAAIGLNCRRHFGIYGNATFSRHPFATAENIDVTIPLQRSRSALHTAVRLTDGLPDLHVVNLHFGLARFERRLQSERLVGEMDAGLSGDAPVVVLGDTNDWRDRLFPTVFRGAGFTRHAPRRRGPTHGTFPSWYPVADLDKVFVRGALRLVRAFPSRLALARVASDHLPVLIEVDLADVREPE